MSPKNPAVIATATDLIFNIFLLPVRIAIADMYSTCCSIDRMDMMVRILNSRQTNPMNEQDVPAVGQVAPEFSVSDSAGAMRTLSDLVSAGPCVLIFYRGHW